VARLSKDIESFEASLATEKPVLVSAAPEDHAGWGNLWRGIAIAGVLVCGSIGLFVFLLWRAIGRLRRRR
jgi:hypothetical protein